MRYFRPAQYSFTPQYVAPPLEFIQQQMDKEQAAYDRNVAYQAEAVGKFASEPFVDAKARQERLDAINAELEAIRQKYHGDYAPATTDLLQVIAREKAVPYWNLNAKQVAEVKRQQELQDKYGLNALLGRDVAKMSLKDEKGNWVNPEDLTASVYNKEDYIQQLKENTANIPKLVRDSNIKKSNDPQYKMVESIKGWTPEEVEIQYNPNSTMAINHAVETIDSMPGLQKYLTEAYGSTDAPEAINFVKQMNYDFAKGNFIGGVDKQFLKNEDYINAYQRSQTGKDEYKGIRMTHLGNQPSVFQGFTSYDDILKASSTGNEEAKAAMIKISQYIKTTPEAKNAPKIALHDKQLADYINGQIVMAKPSLFLNKGAVVDEARRLLEKKYNTPDNLIPRKNPRGEDIMAYKPEAWARMNKELESIDKELTRKWDKIVEWKNRDRVNLEGKINSYIEKMSGTSDEYSFSVDLLDAGTKLDDVKNQAQVILQSLIPPKEYQDKSGTGWDMDKFNELFKEGTKITNYHVTPGSSKTPPTFSVELNGKTLKAKFGKDSQRAVEVIAEQIRQGADLLKDPIERLKQLRLADQMERNYTYSEIPIGINTPAMKLLGINYKGTISEEDTPNGYEYKIPIKSFEMTINDAARISSMLGIPPNIIGGNFIADNKGEGIELLAKLNEFERRAKKYGVSVEELLNTKTVQ